MSETNTNPGVGALRYTPGSDLSAREMTSLEKIGVLRGKCGRYRRAIRDAIDQLPDGSHARSILERALGDHD